MKKIWGILDERSPSRRVAVSALLAALTTSIAFAEDEKAPKAAPTVTSAPSEEKDSAKGGPDASKEGKEDKPSKGEKSGKGGKNSPAHARERLLAAAKALETDADGDPDPKMRAERRAARRAYMKAQLEARKSEGKKPSLSAEQKAELKTKLETAAEARKKGSDKRIADQKAKLKKAYSESHLFRPIRNELRRHAWRVARLERAEDVAEALGRADLVERSKTLLADEETRHTARMKALLEIWKAAGKPKGDPLPPPGATPPGLPPGHPGIKPGAPGAPGSAPKPAAPAAPQPTEGK